MAKKTTALNPKTGKTYAVTKAMQASEKNAIPWTKPPGKIARALWH